MNLNFSAIKESKNLLAFSAGVDSTALFFLLLKQNIPFDIAIVNYNVREQSKEELTYAKELANKYNKQIFIKEITLENLSNFEKKARDIRYSFFEEIINSNSYEILMTAHQLNDKLEWFLMQFTKGAGLFELIGFNEFEEKKNYKIYKPLLEISKSELEKYLKTNNIKYFTDDSNFDEKYKRNYFRKNFANQLVDEFKSGIKSSFNYLQKDIESLNVEHKPIKIFDELAIFKNMHNDNLNIRIIDNEIKKRGILLSSFQREEILKQKEITISHKINISINENYIWISPICSETMDKKFKEKCRINRIPKNIRSYIYSKKIEIDKLIF